MKFPHNFLSAKYVNNTKWELIEAKNCAAAWITSLLTEFGVCCCLIVAVWLTDAITLISKDEVEGCTVSKTEANQVTWWKLSFKQRELLRKEWLFQIKENKLSPYSYWLKPILSSVSGYWGEERGGGCTASWRYWRSWWLGKCFWDFVFFLWPFQVLNI